MFKSLLEITKQLLDLAKDTQGNKEDIEAVQVLPSVHWRETLLGTEQTQATLHDTAARQRLLQEVEREYTQYKEELAQQIKIGALSRDKEDTSFAIYGSALILLTFGYLDVVEDIVTYTPGRAHPMGLLTVCIKWFLPLPEYIDSFDREKVMAWIDANRSKLSWDEAKGMFVFADQL